ncbi:uncharacterized protein B0H18DRAFT_189064 [Fomitopsis serialis]|uniref:uncharacterized protein n=1 Tax=Fomitopsis serialis TaxID=139415 RepID=UPI0020074B73|nr:uncharacterized protein B0H18DRAFT_189064 [Neoantrodia serialis]KAH9937162.1 hypothetical protein B0H18DRAFT_189064 [Neoantrodia serialis]
MKTWMVGQELPIRPARRPTLTYRSSDKQLVNMEIAHLPVVPHSPLSTEDTQASEGASTVGQRHFPATRPRLQTSYECIHHAFVVHALCHPRLDAVVDSDGNATSYVRLLMLSGRLAARLQKQGVRRGTRVCLVVHHSIGYIVGMLAVLRLGPPASLWTADTSRKRYSLRS